ncbi:Bug family tripartite tricarboxylate transporter substrate binding protein [Bordetella genomosp. 10]|nr:tripartite tricarboxylate transporter substrate binding protein [Bordetella genomosp. 10]
MGGFKNGLGLLVAASSAFPLAAMSSGEAADVYPRRPITLVVGFPPGGGADVIARHVAMHMSDDLGQKVIIENRPGAAGNIAAASVARASADGYTLFLAGRPAALHKVLYKSIHYDFARDFVPVGSVVGIPYVLVMGKHVAAANLREAFVLARKNPGKATCASSGIGTTSHLLCEGVGERVGLSWLHVPYPGGVAALKDLVGERIEFAVVSVPAALSLIESGGLRTMVVFSKERVPAIPSVPDAEEQGLGDLEAEGWCAIVAPAGTPAHAVSRLNRSLNKALSNAGLRKKIVQLGYVIPSRQNSPETLESFIEEDTEKWTDILRQRQLGGRQ